MKIRQIDSRRCYKSRWFVLSDSIHCSTSDMLSIRIEEKDVDYNNALTNRNINKTVKKRNVSIFYLTRYVRISIFISFFFSFSLRDIYRSYQREFSFLHTYIYIYISSMMFFAFLIYYISILYLFFCRIFYKSVCPKTRHTFCS